MKPTLTLLAALLLLPLAAFTSHAAKLKSGSTVEDTAKVAKLTVDWPLFLARQDLVWNVLPFYGPTPEGQNPKQVVDAGFVGNGLLGMLVYKDSPKALRFHLCRSDLALKRKLGRMVAGEFLLNVQGEIRKEWMRQDLWNAELRGGFTTDLGTIDWECFSSATTDVQVIKINATGKESPELTFRPRESLGFIPTLSRNDDVQVCLNRHPLQGEYASAWRSKKEGASTKIYYIATESTLPGPGASEKVIKTLEKETTQSFETILHMHRQWWHDWYPRAFVSFSDPVWESFYWIQMYKLASSTRADKPMIDDSGVWAMVNDWGGIWWNLEAQVTYSPVYKANRLDLGQSLTRTLFDNEKTLAANANGFSADSSTLGRTSVYDCGSYAGYETGNLTWALHNVWRQYRYSMDDRMAKERLFPLLKKSVQFNRRLLKNNFIGTIEDTSGKEMTLACNGISIENIDGRKAFEFSAGYGMATLGKSDFSLPLPATFTFWIKAENKKYGGSTTLFTKGKVNKKEDTGLLSILATPKGLQLNSTRDKLSLNSGLSVADGRWHFCSVTLDKDSASMSVDGKVSTTPLKEGLHLPDAKSPMSLGDITRTFLAVPLAMDDFRIYGKGLQEDELADVRKGGVVPDGLLARWSASESKSTPRFSDTALHLPPSHSPEYSDKMMHNPMDCNYTLALLRWGLVTLIDMNKRFEMQDPMAVEWQQTLARLATPPANENGLMIGDGVPFSDPHRHHSHLIGFWPLHIMSSSEAEKSVDFWIKKSVPSDAATAYTFPMAASMLAHLRHPDEALTILNKNLGGKCNLQPNTFWMSGVGADTIWFRPLNEAPSACAEALQDMLLQCVGGTISVFPAVPKAWQHSTFHDLLADGAFLVSGKFSEGRTDWLRVKSLAGEPCIIETDIVEPTQRGGRVFKLEPHAAGTWKIDLRKGEEIILARKGVSNFTVEPVVHSENVSNFWGSAARNLNHHH